MQRVFRSLFLLSAALCASALFASPPLQASLQAKFEPPAAAQLILQLEHSEGWHTSFFGEPQGDPLVWNLPPHWNLRGSARWPRLEKFDFQGESLMGYDATVAVGQEIERDAPADPSIMEAELSQLSATLNLVACGEGQCLPLSFELRPQTFEPPFSTAPHAAASPADIIDSRQDFPIAPSSPSPSTTLMPFGWKTLLFAFLGGLLLNLMPCVFPVLGIKILSFIQHSGASRARMVGRALAYALGIVLSLCALALAVVIFRAGGAALGWGFQLQDPRVLWILMVVLGLVTLSLSGGMELGILGGSFSAKAASHGGLLGAFFSGVLMVAVATPCSAPFLGAALAGVFTLPAAQVFAVLVTMGIGLAAPYVLFALWPAAVKILPKPGKWMDELRALLAWLMGLSAVYLAWVYLGVKPAGLGGLLWAVGALFGVWGIFRWRRWGRFISVAVVLLSVWSALMAPAAPQWEAWTPEREASARAEGRTVVVQFTARWCVSCAVNERVVWRNPRVLHAAQTAVLLKADWTQPNAQIAAELQKFGRAAVPLLVIYAPDGRTTVLPDLLTPSVVERALHF